MDEFEQSDSKKETNDSHNTCYQTAIHYKEKNTFIKNCKCGLFSLVFVTKLEGGMTENVSAGLQKTDRDPKA